MTGKLLYNKNFLKVYATYEEIHEICRDLVKTADCLCNREGRRDDDSRFCGELEEKAAQKLLETKLPIAREERRQRYLALKAQYQ